MALFDHVEASPPDPIFGLMGAFQADTRAKKVNLGVGVYKTPDLVTPIMAVVKEAEQALLDGEKTKEYLPISGDKVFLESTGSLVFGSKLWSQMAGRIAKCQTLGGTGGLRLAGDFLKQEIGGSLYIPEPTWPTHRAVFAQSGFKVPTYPYYNVKTHTLDFKGLFETLSEIPERSIILLHASCHNPSGVDPTLEQWEKLADLFVAKKHVAFFDAAYLGFDVGVEEDAAAIRLFVEKGIEILLEVSFSKNFSLYAERVGALFIVTSSEAVAENVTSKLKFLARRTYSNPPLHGAEIIAEILKRPALKKKWETELFHMRERIAEMRKAFAKALISKSTKKDYNYLSHTKGLFCFCSLRQKEVDKLIKEYGIYMTSDGRINIAGLNPDNMDYVVNAIAAVSE